MNTFRLVWICFVKTSCCLLPGVNTFFKTSCCLLLGVNTFVKTSCYLLPGAMLFLGDQTWYPLFGLFAPVEYYFWRSHWLKLLGWLAARKPPFMSFRCWRTPTRSTNCCHWILTTVLIHLTANSCKTLMNRRRTIIPPWGASRSVTMIISTDLSETPWGRKLVIGVAISSAGRGSSAITQTLLRVFHAAITYQ